MTDNNYKVYVIRYHNYMVTVFCDNVGLTSTTGRLVFTPDSSTIVSGNASSCNQDSYLHDLRT